MEALGADATQWPIISRRSDIWSWAVTVLELFVGEATWSVGHAADTALLAYINDPLLPNHIPRMPPGVSRILENCLQRDPAQRPPNLYGIANALIEEFKKITGNAYALSYPEPSILQADALNNRGISYWDLGEKVRARQAFDEAVRINPLHPQAGYNLTIVKWLCFAELSNLVAVAILERLNKSEDTISEVRYYLGLTYLVRGDTEAAISVLEIQPRSKAVHVNQLLLKAHELRSKRAIESCTGTESDISCFSPDGQYLITFRIFDSKFGLYDTSTGALVSEFRCHTISKAIFSPEGNTILSAGGPNLLKLWDANSGVCLKTFSGQSGVSPAICFSPDSKYVLSASEKAILLWEVATASIVRSFIGSNGVIKSICYSPDGRTAVSAGWDANLILWDIATGNIILNLTGHAGGVGIVAFFPNGRCVISGGSDKTLKLWDIATGTCLMTFVGHTNYIETLAISPNGKLVVSGATHELSVMLWNASTGTCLSSFSYNSRVNVVSFSVDGRYVLIGYHDGAYRKWDISVLEDKHVEESILAPPLSPSRYYDYLGINRGLSILRSYVKQAREELDNGCIDDALVCMRRASGLRGFENHPEAVDLRNEIGAYCRATNISSVWPIRRLAGHADGIVTVCFDSDDRSIVSASGDGTLKKWDIATGECTQTVSGQRRTQICLFGDGRFILTLGDNGTIRKFPWNINACLHEYSGPKEELGYVKFSSCGRYLAIRMYGEIIRLWDVANETYIDSIIGEAPDIAEDSQTLYNWERYFTDIAFSPDGYSLLAGTCHFTLELWSLYSETCKRVYSGHTGRVYSVSVSPDGRMGLSCGEDGTVRVWDVESADCLNCLTGHDSDVTCACFSPDGQFVASVSEDQTVRIWSLDTGQCLHIIEHPNRTFSRVFFSSTGRYIVLTNYESPDIYVWELEWNLETCDVADTDEEVNPFLHNFLTSHAFKNEKPGWTTEDLEYLATSLRNSRRGHMSMDCIRSKLEVLAQSMDSPRLPRPHPQAGES